MGYSESSAFQQSKTVAIMPAPRNIYKNRFSRCDGFAVAAFGAYSTYLYIFFRDSFFLSNFSTLNCWQVNHNVSVFHHFQPVWAIRDVSSVRAERSGTSENVDARFPCSRQVAQKNVNSSTLQLIMVTSKIRFFVTVNTRLSAQLQARVEICFGAFYQLRGITGNHWTHVNHHSVTLLA